MSTQYEIPPQSPHAVIETAEAITLRQMKLDEQHRRTIAHFAGETYEPLSVKERSTQIVGGTALNMLRVENPYVLIRIGDLYGGSFNPSLRSKIVKNLKSYYQDDDKPIEPAIIHSVENMITADTAAQMGVTQSGQAYRFGNMFTSVCRIAQQHRTSPATVYHEDDLYYAAAADAELPIEVIERSIAAVSYMTPESFKQATIQSVRAALTPESVEGLSQAEIDEMVRLTCENPALLRQIDNDLEPIREATRQTFTYRLIRAHGLDALLQIPENKLDVCTPRQAWWPELFQDLLDKA